MTAAHHNKGASGAHRWMNCPASIRLTAEAVAAAGAGRIITSSPAADLGSVAHALAELCLLLNSDTEDLPWYVFEEYPDIPVTAEMGEFVQVYVDYVRGVSATPDSITFIEERVSYDKWVPGGFGTADAIILNRKARHAHVIDLKYGVGHRVHADNNLQAQIYALGVMAENHDIDCFTLHIVQPRLDHISIWNVSRAELMRFGERVSQASEACDDPNAKAVAGDEQCKFCPVKPICPELEALTDRTVMAFFDDDLQPTTPPNLLDDAALIAAMASRKLIYAWLDAVAATVTDRIESGAGFPGFKLVEGKGSRKWTDIAEAQLMLEHLLSVEQAFRHALLSPAQAEKALGAKRKPLIAHIIEKVTGKPVVVPESDKRKAVSITIDNFSEVS